MDAVFFSIGWLAKSLGCSVPTVRRWERDGVIPATALRSTGGNRLYTADQILLCVEHAKKAGRLKEKFGQPLPPTYGLNDLMPGGLGLFLHAESHLDWDHRSRAAALGRDSLGNDPRNFVATGLKC